MTAVAVSSSVAKIASGSALTRSPISRSEALIGRADDVADDAHARAPRSCGSQLVARAAGRGRAASRSAGRPSRPTRAEQRVADQRTAADAGLLDARRRAARRVAARSSSEEAAGWRISTISWSAISLRAHWMMPTPMQQQGDAEGDAEHQVGGAEAADGVPVVADLEDEVGDDEAAIAQIIGDAEQRRDLALGALLGLRVDVGRTPLVRRADPGWGSGSSPVGHVPACVVQSVVASLTRSTLLFERAGGVGGDPDREADAGADADQPGEQALAHRAEAAEAEPAVVGLCPRATGGRR